MCTISHGLATKQRMATDPYSKEALEKYSSLIEATLSGDLNAVKELLKDESIDIQLLVPAGYSLLSSALASAIDSGNKDIIDVYLNSPNIVWERPVATVEYKYAQYKLENVDIGYYGKSNANMVAYALYKNDFRRKAFKRRKMFIY